MENKKLKQGVKEVRGIKMTALEKERMINNIQSLSLSDTVRKPVASPYAFYYSFVSRMSRRSVVYSGSLACLVIILSSGVVFASNGTLPGNALYPFKVRVVEPLKGTFIFSNEAKIKYESELATLRLVEAETLADQNMLDQLTEEKLNLLLENHTKAFNQAIDDFRKSDLADEDTDDDAVINFQSIMNAHAQVLDVLNENKFNTDAPQNIKISKTARDNATKIRETLKSKERKNSAVHKRTREAVQSIIDIASTDADGVATPQSASRAKIITNTHKRLDQARAFLQEVEEENKKGDSKNAYEKLLDSESSAREASIFLETGLGLKIGR